MDTRSFRTAAGTGLHVELDGRPDAPVTVVLAHGWTLDSRSWGPVAAALTSVHGGVTRPSVRVIRYDHRGHGRSELPARADMTIDGLADDLAELVTELAPTGPVVLGGHSMGGMTIMALAERHPALLAERVAGIALVSTASGGLAETNLGLSVRMLGLVRKGEAKLAEAAWVDRRPALTRRPALLAPGLRALLVGRGADRGALRITTRCLADCRPAAMVGFRPTLNEHERDAALAAFDGIPTEVLVGTSDKLTPVYQSRRIVEHARRARLTLYPGAGHMLPLERVDGVAGRLAELVEAAASRGDTALSRAPSGSALAPATPAGT
ncbi:MAG TPA: alpha/beta hydrolase [Pseudonocardia sp.]|jgi:pimeloyl-ACP methyl ester carboxylesterase|nr:alpha/beta hydrolase [Pseudonocardia sp.]